MSPETKLAMFIGYKDTKLFKSKSKPVLKGCLQNNSRILKFKKSLYGHELWVVIQAEEKSFLHREAGLTLALETE